MKLNVKAFAITCSLTWGFGLFCLTWWFIFLNGATGELTLIGKMYPGYNMSPVGSVIGLLWALVDGAVCGGIFALLYNLIAGRGTSDEV